MREFGLELDQQSALDFLLFIHADRRSRFMPFGVFSDERYHVVEGNDRIADGLAADLPQPVLHGHTLIRAARRLQRSLATTNAAESLLSRIRHVKRNVKAPGRTGREGCSR